MNSGLIFEKEINLLIRINSSDFKLREAYKELYRDIKCCNDGTIR